MFSHDRENRASIRGADKRKRGAKRGLSGVGAALGLAFCAAASAHAGQQGADGAAELTSKDVMAAYRAYNDAIAAGDTKVATAQAKLAFERAEAVWGASNNTTGLLATNYADRLAVAGEDRAALPLYERCIEILQPEIETERFNLGYCQYRAGITATTVKKSGASKRYYEAAVETFEPLTEANVQAAGYSGEALLALAQLSTPTRSVSAPTAEVARSKLKRRLSAPADLAARAVPLLSKRYGETAEILAPAFVQIGYAHETADEWALAEQAYKRAYDVLAPVRPEDDYALAHVYSRMKFSGAKVWVAEREKTSTVSETGVDEGNAGEGELQSAFSSQLIKAGCKLVEQDGEQITLCVKKQRAPSFPETQAYRGHEGFALVIYSVNEKGRTEDVTVHDSWPGAAFSKAAERAVRGWVFEPPVNETGEPRVLRENTILFSFHLR